MEPWHKLSGNNYVVDAMVRQDCLDHNEWLDVALTMESVNWQHSLILLYSILICIGL